MYFRQHGDAYGVGCYHHVPLMVDPHDLGKTAKRDFTPEHFSPAWDSTTELMPALKNTELTTKFNGMFAFTIDGLPIMGEATTQGLLDGIGLWLTHSGGAGRAMAEWMTGGAPNSTCARPISIASTATPLPAPTWSSAATPVRRSLRPHPSVAADGKAAQCPPQPVPSRACKSRTASSSRAAAGSGRSGWKPMRGCSKCTKCPPAPAGRPVLVADPGRRTSGDARAGGHV